MKHTKGPWTATMGECIPATSSKSARLTNARVMIPSSPVKVVELDHGEEWDANARLISAAPDLLEALKELLPYAINDIEKRIAQMSGDLYPRILEARIKQARDAIQKAEGGT